MIATSGDGRYCENPKHHRLLPTVMHPDEGGALVGDVVTPVMCGRIPSRAPRQRADGPRTPLSVPGTASRTVTKG